MNDVYRSSPTEDPALPGASDEESPVRRRTKRRRLIAGLLSLWVPGLGQLYNTQFRKAGVFLGLFVALVVVSVSSGLLHTFPGFILFLAVGSGVLLVAIGEAAWTAGRLGAIPLRPYNRWWLYLLIGVGCGVASQTLIQSSMPVKTFFIPAGSMEPALEVGDRIVVRLLPRDHSDFERGELVIFASPEDPSLDLIKRIIALPGETIEVVDKMVFIDASPLEDPWGVHRDPRLFSRNSVFGEAARRRDHFGPFTVPDDAVFVLGNNRDYSYDSRFWGAVPLNLISGEALYIYWSKDRSRIGTRLD
jgi:signal peptidase I